MIEWVTVGVLAWTVVACVVADRWDKRVNEARYRLGGGK